MTVHKTQGINSSQCQQDILLVTTAIQFEVPHYFLDGRPPCFDRHYPTRPWWHMRTKNTLDPSGNARLNTAKLFENSFESLQHPVFLYQ